MKKIVIFLILLGACTSSRTLPIWVQNSYIPVNSDKIFYSIHHVNLGKGSKAKVRAECLRDISTQIYSNIEYEYQNKTEETNNKINESMKTNLKLYSSFHFIGNDLIEKEFIDSKGNYWLFVSLNKNKFRERLGHELQRIKKEVKEKNDYSRKLLKEKKIVETIKNSLVAAQNLLEAKKLFALFPQNNFSPRLFQENDRLFINALSQIIISPITKRSIFRYNEEKILRFRIYSLSGDDGKVQRGLVLPLSLSSKLEGINYNAFSDSSGSVVFNIPNNLKIGKQYHVICQIAWNDFLDSSSVNYIVKKYGNYLPSSSLDFIIRKPVVKLQLVNNSQLSKSVETSLCSIVKNLIEKVNNNRAEILENDNSNSDFIMNVNVNIEKLGNITKQYGVDLFSSALSLSFSVIDAKNKTNMFASKIISKKGVGISQESSIMNVINKLNDKELINTFNKFFTTLSLQ